MRRGQQLLIAQRKGRGALGPPSAWLSAEEAQAWRDVVAAAPDVLRATHRIQMRTIARALAGWRLDGGDLRSLRLLYRLLGSVFVPMQERRRLILPKRAGT